MNHLRELSHHKTLLVMDLSGCNLGDNGMQRMFSNLEAFRPWLSINLSNNFISETGLGWLSTAIRA
jgi:hypothetical protein